MKQVLAIVFMLLSIFCKSQTFYVNVSAGLPYYNLTYQLTLGNCDSQRIYTCIPTAANGINEDYTYNDMAIDTMGNIYYVSAQGNLYTRKLSDINSCQYLGNFDNDTVIEALTTDVTGNVYAAGTSGYTSVSKLYRYSHTTKTFSTIGILPSIYGVYGDLFFYQGKLFWTALNSQGTFLVEINISNPSESCNYMSLGNMVAYAAFSIENGNCSDAYVFDTQGDSSILYKLDLVNKTISDRLCAYPFSVFGAASVYKFSPSIIDSSECLPVTNQCTSMPVSLIDFSYYVSDNNVILVWKTASESNSNYYSIEKSNDGVNFYEIGKISAAGFSSILQTYKFSDKNPDEQNYYRLKETDLNSRIMYSNVLFVELPVPIPALKIIGNPAKNVLNIKTTTSSQSNLFTIYDFLGRKIKSLYST